MANPVLVPWLAEIGIISWRTFTGNGTTVVKSTKAGAGAFSYELAPRKNPVARPPLPSEILSTIIVFGTYSVIANGGGSRPQIGAMLGWGTFLATALVFASSPPKKSANTVSTVHASNTKVTVA